MTDHSHDPEQGAVPPSFTLDPDQLATVVEHRDYDFITHHGGVNALATALKTSTHSGLSGDELGMGFNARIEKYGANVMKYPPPKSFFMLLLAAFKDVTILILCFASVVSLAVGLAVEKKRNDFGYLEGAAILLVVGVVVCSQAVIDHQKQKKFRRLNAIRDNHDVQVIRAGVTTTRPVDQIVVGDVIKVSAGDKIPADGLLIEGSGLKTNEASMTGEPIDIEKTPGGDIFLISGTTVSEGVGTVLVVAVGPRSQWGIIIQSLIVAPADTPLQERLNQLAMTIGKLGILFAVLTFIISVIRWIIFSATFEEDNAPNPDNILREPWDASELLDFFIDAVTIVVVAVPEGLPLAITLSLAFAMRKMMMDNNLVRRLEACETMGSATQLNADKTGTLTQNRMTVVEATWSGQNVLYEGNPNGDSGIISGAFRQLTATSISVNTQANLEHTAGGVVEHLGSKTECALLQLVENWDFDYKRIRETHTSHRVYMFDSIRKCMSSTEILSHNLVRCYTKGAPEIVLRSCVKRLDGDGVTITGLDETSKNAVLRAVEDMARRGLRTLLLAYRDIEHDPHDDAFWRQPPDTDLTYLGVVGIKDPIRPETKEAVLQLKRAGVNVRMVTGDNALTATFIAKESGILDDDGIVLEGPRFRAMTDRQIEQIALRIQVLARSTPNDKLRLVRIHKKLGEVTSVTGDGTNDGPALKEADVGFALGIAGTEVAKEACDIVILDDNIKSMTKAVLWGRNVYESIRKFLQFQLVVNVVAVTLNFISACVGEPLPLGAVPLLWVNMIMDSMGALALATEPPRKELLDRKPFGRRAPLINRAMFRNIVGISVFQLAVCLLLQFLGEEIFGISCSEEARRQGLEICQNEIDLEVNSIIFNVFVFMQIGSEVNSRRIEEKNIFSRIHKSGMFLGIIFFTVLVQVGLMFGVGASTVGEKIGIVRINAYGWLAALVLGALVLPWGYLVRCFPLDWCFGPTDRNPLEMSKLEKLLHFPKRKPFRDSDESEIHENPHKDVDDFDVSSRSTETFPSIYKAGDQVVKVTGKGMRQTSALTRLRAFVHAVAFVNAVSKSTRAKTFSSPSSSAPSFGEP